MSYQQPDLLDDYSFATTSGGSHTQSLSREPSFSSPPPPEYGSEPYSPASPSAMMVSPSSSVKTENSMWSYDQARPNTQLGFPNSPVDVKAVPVAPDLDKLKKKRRRKTAAAGIVGGVVGLATLGPVGMVAGGVGGAMVTKAVGKRKERRRMRKYQHSLQATNATDSMSVVPAESAILA